LPEVGRFMRAAPLAETAQLHQIAEAWRPLRTWAAVLIRAATPRLLDA
jgi:hypothetical protein